MVPFLAIRAILLAQPEFGVGLGGEGEDAWWLGLFLFLFSLILDVWGVIRKLISLALSVCFLFGNENVFFAQFKFRVGLGGVVGDACWLGSFLPPVLTHSQGLRGHLKADIRSFGDYGLDDTRTMNGNGTNDEIVEHSHSRHHRLTARSIQCRLLFTSTGPPSVRGNHPPLVILCSMKLFGVSINSVKGLRGSLGFENGL